MRKALWIVFVALGLLVACNSSPPQQGLDPEELNLGVAKQPLLVLGQACNLDTQCDSNHCADTVCCNTACQPGAPGDRDNFVCSNVYNPTKAGQTVLREWGPDGIMGNGDDTVGKIPGGGPVPYIGTCTQLQEGDPCGSLEGLNPCTWRGSDINGGGQCPSPGNGTPAKACYTCSAGNNTCPPGLPICTQVGGVYGCTTCQSNFGTGGAAACPTSLFPVCLLSTGACVECTASDPGRCDDPGVNKTCDGTLNKCISCLTDFNGLPKTADECPAATPFCIGSGLAAQCVQCKAGAGNDTVCTAMQQVCKTGSNTCVNCLPPATPGAGPTNCSATGPNPVCDPITNNCGPCGSNFVTGVGAECPFGAVAPAPDLPACIAGGFCKECSATDETVCKLPGSTKTHCSDAVGLGANMCVECNVGFPTVPSDCPAVGNKFCANHMCTNTCGSNADCTAPTPKCTAGGTCVECLTANGDADCVGVAGRPFCGTGNPQAGTTCVACRTSNDCSGLTPVCNSNGVCQGCVGNNDDGGALACPNPLLPACKSNGACVECTNGPTGELVRCTDPNIVCNSTANQPTTDKCVPCTSNAQCTTNAPICDLASHTCKGCTADLGGGGLACPDPNTPACILATGRCVQCRQAPAPPNLTACDDPAKTVCNPSFMCVQCTSDAQCVGNILNVCNLQTFRCTAACAGPADCAATPQTPVCKPAAGGAPALCVECTDSALHCSGAKPSCDATNKCVACLTDAACSGATPICNAGNCVPCDGNLGDGGNACKSATAPACVTAAIGPQADIGKCVECTNTEDSLCVGAKPACNPTSHTCVTCGTNTQCSGNTPICDPAGTCRACNGDLGSGQSLKCYKAMEPACITAAGATQGSCQECNTGNITACTTAEPVCDLTANMCAECNVNADCTGPNGVCDTSQHKCTLGCTSDANCTMAAPACKLTGVPNMICVDCTATNKTKCTGATPNCDLTTNKCVGCTMGSECPGDKPVCDPVTKMCTATCTLSSQCPGDAPVCDPVTKKCVDCVTNADCKPPTPICNTTTHMCGTDCTKNSECPGDAPICNPMTKKCVDCVTNNDCKPPTPICNTATGMCGTECSKNSECPGSAPICNPQTKNCVECIDDTTCPAERPLCDGQLNKCVESGSVEGGGCSCSTVQDGRATTVPMLLGLGLVVTALARRRRGQVGLRPLTRSTREPPRL